MTSFAAGKIPYLPERIQQLEALALNLAWRWNRQARALLRMVDPILWSLTRHNPVEMLQRVDPATLARCAVDPAFLELYDHTIARLDDQLSTPDTWWAERFPELGAERPVAYFCAEFGLHNSIPIYSGGLGVLAGDHCKAASDLGVPLVGVGLLYSRGYFDQAINVDGWQEDTDEVFDPAIMPLVRLTGQGGRAALARVPGWGREIHLGVWRLKAGRVNLFLLDANLPENHPEDRELTHKLYGGGSEYRLKQEWVLGVGGVRVLRALGVEPGAWHANEGHAAFMLTERVAEQVRRGVDPDEAIARVRAESVFTTHTPVPAGHDMFAQDQIEACLEGAWDEVALDPRRFLALGHHPELDHGRFHMTALAIRLARHVNGVSRRHGQVTRSLWQCLWPERTEERVPIGSITNGVHLASWMSHRIMDLLDALVGPDWERRAGDPEFWPTVLEIDDAALWEAHLAQKAILLDFMREQARRRWRSHQWEASHLVGSGTLLGPEPLTIGFARRFATYKRAGLLFRDPERLRALLTDDHRPVQIVFAGKAHPADDEAKRILQRIYQATRDPAFHGRIAFLEDYELHVAHRLVQGVDLWLNLPRAPLEASGTSGMKAALNGVPQLGTLDGWWAEGFIGRNGWALPLAAGDNETVDALDHEHLFQLLEREVVPRFYDRNENGVPEAWVHMAKHAIVEAGRRFTTARMVREYAERYYAPALAGETHGDEPPTG
jgi:glycogen phosphorylase